MAINKVVYGSNTLIDLSGDTVASAYVASGVSFHAADGTAQTGTAPTKAQILNAVYPVGSIYMNTNAVNPGTLFGGTWEQIQDRFLLGAGSSYPAGTTGGAAMVSHAHSMDHTHTEGDLRAAIGATANQPRYIGYVASPPSSRGPAYVGAYTVTGSSATSATQTFNHYTLVFGTTSNSSTTITGSTTISTMPPYLAVYVWKRIA